MYKFLLFIGVIAFYFLCVENTIPQVVNSLEQLQAIKESINAEN